MAQAHCNGSRQVTAAQVHDLTMDVLENQFDLRLDSNRYEARDIWAVLVAAAVERLTIEAACDLLEHPPSANTVRNGIGALLADEAQLMRLEDDVNALLQARLPKKLLQRALPCAVDITAIPYHGRHEDGDAYIRRGRAKGGTTHFHCYATLYTVKRHRRYTLAVTLLRSTDKVLDGLQRLLERADTLNLRLKRLYLDREFDNNAVVAFLQTQPFPSILPLKIRGKTGGTRALLQGRKSYQTTYTRQSVKYGAQTFPVFIVCKYCKGRYGRKGVFRFAYVVIGTLRLTPHQVYEEYRQRFGIETSYRLMNTMRARTAATSAALRLFFVALALLLLNLWSFVKWRFLYQRQRGPRQVMHQLLPLARWRLWLWEMIKQRLGFSLAITVPIAP